MEVFVVAKLCKIIKMVSTHFRVKPLQVTFNSSWRKKKHIANAFAGSAL